MINELLKKYEQHGSFFIGEIGSAHGGSLSHAKEIIDAFYEVGVRVFKFQHVIASEILHPNTGELTLIGNKVNLYESFQKLEQTKQFYSELQDYCEKKKSLFFASSFGLGSSKDLQEIGMKAWKVASPESNYIDLLKYFESTHKPVFLSTGVTQLEDVENALHYLDSLNTIVLHCVTQYPAEERDMNLLLMASYKNYFGVTTGLSDHSLDPLFIPTVAFVLSRLMGQTFVLEKHITLDRSGDGLDDKISLLLSDVKEMLSNFERFNRETKATPKLFEDIFPFKSTYLTEIVETIQKITQYDINRVALALGDGFKRLAKCEEDNYITTNRSYRARVDIAKGEAITEDKVAFLRCEKNLKPGLGYQYYHHLFKTVAKKDILASEPITLDNAEL